MPWEGLSATAASPSFFLRLKVTMRRIQMSHFMRNVHLPRRRRGLPTFSHQHPRCRPRRREIQARP